METRELYKQKYEAQMREWSARLETMKAQAEKLTAEAKLEVKPHVDSVQLKFDAAKAKLDLLATAADDKLQELGQEVDSGWSELKAAAGGAYDALRRHKVKATKTEATKTDTTPVSNPSSR